MIFVQLVSARDTQRRDEPSSHAHSDPIEDHLLSQSHSSGATHFTSSSFSSAGALHNAPYRATPPPPSSFPEAEEGSVAGRSVLNSKTLLHSSAALVND